jgi:hypothetical protein
VAAVLDLSELFDASYGRLVAQLYALCGDLTTAEDAVQGAFVPAIRKSRELARVRSPEAWMRAVAVRWPGARASMGGTARTCAGPRRPPRLRGSRCAPPTLPTTSRARR